MRLHRWSKVALVGSLHRVFSALLSIRILTPVTVCFIIALALIGSINSPIVDAAPGINKTINFQGRLFNSAGAVVADGYYNVQFKIYQDGDGQSVGNTTGSPAGTLKWTENRLNSGGAGGGGTTGQGVQVKNGFMSVELGSITPFGSSVDWNQDTIYLSMNIGNTNITCTPFSSCAGDGEMIPMKKMTATPYALNAGALNGLTTDNLVQFAPNTVQADASTNTNSIFINKTGSGGSIVNLQANGTDAFTVGNAGDLAFGKNANHTISVTTADASTAGKTLTVSAGGGGSGTGSAGGTLTLQGGAAGGTNANGGGVDIDSGAKTGSGTGGSINIGIANASTINIGSIGSSTVASTVHIADSTGAAQTVTIGGTNSGSNTTIRGGGYSVATTNTGVAVSGAGTGNSLSVTSSANPNLSTNGLLVVNNSNVSASGNLMALQNNGANRFTVDASGNTVASGNLKYTDSGVSATTMVCKDASGYLSGCNTTGNGAAFVQGGNNFGADAVIGTTGAGQQLTFKTGGTDRMTLNSTGSALTFLQAATINTNGATALGLDTGGAAALTIGTANTNALSIGNTSGSFTAESNGTANLFNGNTAHTIQMGTASGSAQTITIGSTNASSTSTMQGGAYSIVARNTGIGINTGANAPTADLTFGDNGGAGRSINVLKRTTNAAGDALNITAGAGGNGASANAGGALNLSGGAGGGTNGNGGDVAISGGLKNGSGTDGRITLSTSGIARATFDAASSLYLGNGVTAAAPSNFTVSGTGSTTTAVTGGGLSIQGGNATVGNANGGSVTLSGGSGVGTGSAGLVVLTTPTYQTAATQLCSSTPCTITQANVDGNGAIVINTNGSGYTVSLPNPSQSSLGAAAYGRIVYVTSASSNDFTLAVNGGGTGNQIAMRNNTTATMVWGPNGWTAAGASSSTTLQAAYDNTLTSAGGAELVLSNGSNANGLTIRDSSTSPVNGTLLEVQNSAAATLFAVNSNVTEYASNAGAESTFTANDWTAAPVSATITRDTTASNIATGQAAVSVITSTTALSGVRNKLSTALTANQHYNVSFTAKLPTGASAFTDLEVYYSKDGTNSDVKCIDAQAIKTSVWTKINCAFTASSASITPSNAIFIRQTSGGTSRTFYIDNLSVTIAADYNYATDGTVNSSLGTNWITTGTSSVTRITTDGQEASDSAQVTAGTASNNGIANKLSINPLSAKLYRVSVYAKYISGTAFTDFKARYTPDGGSTFKDCVDYNTQSVPGSWTQITCYIDTTGTTASNPYVQFVQPSGAASARTYLIDSFSFTLASNTTPNVQIGSGISGGPTTLFTLDKGASAPIAANNDALLGSMYYDTTLGKLQCYEADGWGACGSSPDNVVTISPEYTNAVMHGTGVGTMTSDLCSDLLNINDPTNAPQICGTNETYNFYQWTSPQALSQVYSIYVTYQLPSTFKSFTSGSTSVKGRTDNGSNGGAASLQYTVYKNASTGGMTACNSSPVVVSSGTQSSWQAGLATGTADPSSCSFAANDSIVFKIDMSASKNALTYVTNLGFTFSNK